MENNSKEKQLKDEHWRGKEYSFYSHKKCESFPCHSGLDEESFNCLFCYCPLYMLDDKCGGSFKYMKNGIKNCADCIVPHKRENYGYITERFKEIAEQMTAKREGR